MLLHEGSAIIPPKASQAQDSFQVKRASYNSSDTREIPEIGLYGTFAGNSIAIKVHPADPKHHSKCWAAGHDYIRATITTDADNPTPLPNKELNKIISGKAPIIASKTHSNVTENTEQIEAGIKKILAILPKFKILENAKGAHWNSALTGFEEGIMQLKNIERSSNSKS